MSQALLVLAGALSGAAVAIPVTLRAVAWLRADRKRSGAWWAPLAILAPLYVTCVVVSLATVRIGILLGVVKS